MNMLDSILLFENISWREPLWVLLAFVPALPFLLNMLFRKNKHDFADKHLTPWVMPHEPTRLINSIFSKNSAYLIAWILLSIAATGPRIPSEISMNETATNIDVMLVVDVSQSMHVTDIHPSRLSRASIEIEEFLNRADGTRVGIIVFAARPHLFVPLTFDHEAIRHYIRSLDDLILPTSGSDPLAALEMANKELSGHVNPAAMIILSDGDFSEIKNTNGLLDFIEPDIPIYALGIGTDEGGGILLKNGSWLKNQGQPVISRLNEKNIHALLAKNIGGIGATSNDLHDGRYSLVTTNESDWEKIYDEGISSLVTAPEKNASHEMIWTELYYWPLFPALVLLWISLIPLGFRIRPFTDSPQTKNKNVTKNILIIFALMAGSGIWPTQTALAENMGALDVNSEINIFHAFEKYNNGDYSSAKILYSNIKGFAARLGEGACHYKLKDYNSAIRQYSQAVIIASNDNERATALFNLGNSYFKLGNYSEAIFLYRDALLYNPLQRNVVHNLEFSVALNKYVNERRKQINQTSRMGSGPQLAPSREAIENNQTGSLSIDQSISRQTSTTKLPKIPGISESELELLIQKGLKRVKLAAETINSIKHSKINRNNLSLIRARLMMSGLEDQQTELWKRLFEMEEGFPAPLSAPKKVPGVSPW